MTEQTDAPDELVRFYLQGQNLEQIRRTDEAIECYERAVRAGFDAAGPYDRLIYIYRAREDHAEVARVAEEALASVRTFDDKRSWYERLRDQASDAARTQPDPPNRRPFQADPRGAEF